MRGELYSMTAIYPIILAGGSGTRLWPLSRKSYPKQFSNILDDDSLFQKTAKRLTNQNVLKFHPHIVVAPSDYRFIVVEQLQSVGINPGPIILEPEPKNTAAAILAASIFAMEKDPESLLLIAPSDHIIRDEEGFCDSLLKGLGCVETGHIVTFGIKPTGPLTAFGYIELPNKLGAEPIKPKRFVEKPDSDTAQLMIDKGNHVWNAGIFLCRATDIVFAFSKYKPKLLKTVRTAVEKGHSDLGFWRLDARSWAECENISIDYAIMERADNLTVVPLSVGWSDLGGWNGIWEVSKPDKNGMVTSKNAFGINCQNSLLRSETTNQVLVGLDLEGIVAVAMPDAVLVAKKESVEGVGEVVKYLKKQKAVQAEELPKDHRPWGYFEVLSTGRKYKVKCITVNAGATLSLQTHKYRSEHWVVVEGTGKVTVDTKTKVLTEGESVYVPVGAVHRLENHGRKAMVLIEVQTGTYFGEDDIIRYDDQYKRS